MAQRLLDQYRTNIGEVALIPSSGGAFEVTVDGAKLYSKLETGKFPDERGIVKEVGTKI